MQSLSRRLQLQPAAFWIQWRLAKNHLESYPMRTVLGPLAAVLLLISATALAQDGYYRQPDLHNDTVVFVSEGDLWRVPLEGRKARRLTTHPAEESQPAVSPDGRRVAFVASCQGAPGGYIVPLGGGEARGVGFDGRQGGAAG